jgi:uncharacterized protein DUF4431
MTSKASRKTSFSVGLIALLLGVFRFTGAQDTGWLHYAPEVVRLQGKVTTVVRFGPPGYGENPDTDAVEIPIILVLAAPVRIERKTNITHIQLVFHERDFPDYRNFINKEVVITGTLFEAFTGHHATDVLLEVETVKVISSQMRGTGHDAGSVSAARPKAAKKGMPTGWVPRKPEIATVEGTLTKVSKYGAPNYGDPETDKKLDVPILTLRWPATVDLIADNVTYVQLIFSGKTGYEKYLDRSVRVTGTLSEAASKDHFTKVVMEVKTIALITSKE